jgi:hypothetical protein
LWAVLFLVTSSGGGSHVIHIVLSTFAEGLYILMGIKLKMNIFVIYPHSGRVFPEYFL